MHLPIEIQLGIALFNSLALCALVAFVPQLNRLWRKWRHLVRRAHEIAIFTMYGTALTLMLFAVIHRLDREDPEPEMNQPAVVFTRAEAMMPIPRLSSSMPMATQNVAR